MKRAHICLIVMLAAPLAATAQRTIGPDSAGYKATETSYSFIDIAQTGARVLSGTDDDTVVMNIGFTFRFYNQDYTSVCASSNGLLSFGGCNSDFANVDLTSARPSVDFPAIAPYWMNLTFAKSGAGAVLYQTLGSPPSRRFVVQWNNAFAINGADGVTFQVILSESSNGILFQYKDVDAGIGSPASRGALATVGIRATGGESNGRRLQWSYDAPVIANATALLFSATDKAPTITAIVSLNPALLRQEVTFKATPNAAAGSGTPNGMIRFFVDGTALGSPVSLSEGAAFSLPVNTLSVGTHTATAEYGGDDSFRSSSATIDQVITYGICLLYNQNASTPSGAAILIRLALCDALGTDVSSANVVVNAKAIRRGSTLIRNPNNDFRFDSTLGTAGGYFYTLDTKDLSSGSYTLEFTVAGDPVAHSAGFTVQ